MPYVRFYLYFLDLYYLKHLVIVYLFKENNFAINKLKAPFFTSLFAIQLISIQLFDQNSSIKHLRVDEVTTFLRPWNALEFQKKFQMVVQYQRKEIHAL